MHQSSKFHNVAVITDIKLKYISCWSWSLSYQQTHACLITQCVLLKYQFQTFCTYLILGNKMWIIRVSRPIGEIKDKFLLDISWLVSFQSNLTIQLKWHKKILTFPNIYFTMKIHQSHQIIMSILGFPHLEISARNASPNHQSILHAIYHLECYYS